MRRWIGLGAAIAATIGSSVTNLPGWVELAIQIAAVVGAGRNTAIVNPAALKDCDNPRGPLPSCGAD